MTRWRTSPEHLLQSSLAPHRAKDGVDLGLAYDDGEGSIEGLGVGLCAKNLPGPVELALVEPNVLVTQGGRRRHVTSRFSVHNPAIRVHRLHVDGSGPGA